MASALDFNKKIYQDGSTIYAATATGNDTYVITLAPVPAAYVNGMVINFKTDVANVGPATLNVNGLGAIAINKLNDQALINNDIEANQIVTVVYNSTGPKFQMVSQLASGGGGGGLAWNSIAGAAQAAAVNNGYIVANAAQTTVTLPAVFAIGDTIQVQGLGAAGWILAPAAGDTIHLGSSAAVTSLTSANRYDVIQVVGLVADAEWSTSFVYSAGLTVV